MVEQRDASPDERAIDEVDTSIYAFRRDLLGPALRRLSPDNAQGEYYLTDVIGVLAGAGYPVGAVVVADPGETQGVNDRAQMAVAEAELRARTNRRWLLNGVTHARSGRRPTSTSRSSSAGTSPCTRARSSRAARWSAPGARSAPTPASIDCSVGSGAVVENAVARESEIGAGARVGPYSVLQPGSRVAAGVATGAFYTGLPD